MSILGMKKESAVAATAVIVIALIALSTEAPLAVPNGGVSAGQAKAPNGGSVTRSGWAVEGTVHILYPPCPYGVVCGPIYQIIGIGGPACAFPPSHPVCLVVVQQGTWVMYFTPCLPNATICPQYELKPPKQGEHIIAYGIDIVPSKNGSNYAGDLYVSSWIRVKS